MPSISQTPNRTDNFLTQRETVVLQCLAEGMSDDEIAIALNTAHSTVKAHADHIYQKLNMRSPTPSAKDARQLDRRRFAGSPIRNRPYEVSRITSPILG